MAAAEKSPDLILIWMVSAPPDYELPQSEVVFDGQAGLAQVREKLRTHFRSLKVGGPVPRTFVDLGRNTWGVTGSLRCTEGLSTFKGMCKLDGSEDGQAYVDLGLTDLADGSEHVVLLPQQIFCAFLCRAWARENALNTVRPLLGEGRTCPFSHQSPVKLDTDEAMAEHYFELLMSRGPKDKCPLAEKYLQGVAREMQLSQQSYFRSLLEGRFGLRADDSVLHVLQTLDKLEKEVPRDLCQDLSSGVAGKVLELVQVMGLNL